MRANDEEQIQCAIWQHYLIRGNALAIAYAVPNGEARSKATGGRLKAMGVVPGVPDFAGVTPDGAPWFLELKTRYGKLSPAQVAFEQRCACIGVAHHVAYSLDSALEFLEAIGVLKGETNG